MRHELKGFDKFKAILAKWIVLNIAARISPLAVFALCLEVSRDYTASIEANDDEY
jgi:hypothetical protein